MSPSSFIAYRWGRELVRSSGIHSENKTHPHVIKDFVSSLQRNIGNKITNKWAELRNPPHTLKQAFNLADRIESQLQVANSFRLELSNDYSTADIKEVSAEEASGDEFEVNEVNRNGKQGYNYNYSKGNYGNNQNFRNKPHYNSRTQDNKTGKNWVHKEKDSKITLLQESSHFVPAKFSASFFRQFDLTMKLRRDQLRETLLKYLELPRTKWWKQARY